MDEQSNDLKAKAESALHELVSGIVTKDRQLLREDIIKYVRSLEMKMFVMELKAKGELPKGDEN